jgi:DNA-binding CsgD family transcriptional regulator
MKPDSPLNILDQIWSARKLELLEEDYIEFEKKIVFLERLAEVENSSVIVMDFNQRKYTFLRSKFIDPFDDPSIDHDAGDPLYYSQFIHPDDKPLVFDSYRKSFDFISSLPVTERKDYKLILNFRQRDKNGIYLNLILQLVVLELDRDGNIWLVLIIDDILPDRIKFTKVSRRLMNIRNGSVALFRNEDRRKQKTILSSREIQVLGLVSRGFASKEIANRLFLSVSTVNNHRQNILEKISAANTSEAINYAKNLGLL